MSKHTEIADVLSAPEIGKEILVKGWVRAFRSNRFIALNDGSTINNLQVVVDFEQFDEELIKRIGFHACVAAKGTLVESQGAGQSVELQAMEIEILGDTDLSVYPLQPKRQTMEFLRGKSTPAYAHEYL